MCYRYYNSAGENYQVAAELLEIALGITDMKEMEGEKYDCAKKSEI